MAPAHDTRQIAHYHAEAVEKWDRDADSVAGPELLGPAHEPAIVQDVSVRQRIAPFGWPVVAAGELDIDRIVAGRARRLYRVDG